MKTEILEKMKRRGTAAPNLTESDIDLDLNYTSDMESRYRIMIWISVKRQCLLIFSCYCISEKLLQDWYSFERI